MYISRGYVLDGRGISYKNVPVNPGETVMVDDDLLLYLVISYSKNKRQYVHCRLFAFM